MKLGQAAGAAHLTYCTNIHRGETWADTRAALERHLPEVKRQVSPAAAMGVGLRLSNVASETLAADGGELDQFKAFLAAHGLYVFTINGFPYGPFHAEPVKAAVYRPDWRERERGRYTSDLAALLVELLPEGQSGSISTVPGGFKADLAAPDQVARAAEVIAQQLVEQALELHRLRERTGRSVTLALEPEPCCLLETTSETLDFFEQELWSRRSREWLSAQLGIQPGQAEEI